MLILYYNQTYGKITNHDHGGNNGKKDGNDDENYTPESGSDGLISDPIMTPQYCGGGLGNDHDGAAAAAHYISMRHTIYLTYKDPIKDIP